MLRYYKETLETPKQTIKNYFVDDNGFMSYQGRQERVVTTPEPVIYFVEHKCGELMIEAKPPEGDYIEVDKSDFDQYWKDFVEKNKHNFGAES